MVFHRQQLLLTTARISTRADAPLRITRNAASFLPSYARTVLARPPARREFVHDTQREDA